MLLNSNIKNGIVDITLPPSGDYSAHITFDTPFDKLPAITAITTNSTSLEGTWGYNTMGISKIRTSGFAANVHNLEKVERKLRLCWIAIATK